MNLPCNKALFTRLLVTLLPSAAAIAVGQSAQPRIGNHIFAKINEINEINHLLSEGGNKIFGLSFKNKQGFEKQNFCMH